MKKGLSLLFKLNINDNMYLVWKKNIILSALFTWHINPS